MKDAVSECCVYRSYELRSGIHVFCDWLAERRNARSVLIALDVLSLVLHVLTLNSHIYGTQCSGYSPCVSMATGVGAWWEV